MNGADGGASENSVAIEFDSLDIIGNKATNVVIKHKTLPRRH
jgi:hypothetical protein